MHKKILNILIIFLLIFSILNFFKINFNNNFSFTINVYSEDFFSDVPPDHWAYQAILYLYQHNLIKGFPDNTFRGDKPMTRYEMAYLIYNMLMELKKNANISQDSTDFEQEIKQLLAKSVITEEEAKLIKDLIAEFKDELLDLNKRVASLENRVDKLENNKIPLYISLVSLFFSALALIFVLSK